MTDSVCGNGAGITMDQEIEIKASDTLVANILDAYPDKTPIYVKNQEGKYIGCSKGFLKLLNLPSDAVLGRTAGDLFPEHIAKEDEMGDRTLQWVVGQEKMEVALDINGKERFLLFRKNVFCSGQGTLSGGVIGVVTDITEFKCRNFQKEMRDALASVSSGVFHDINNLLMPITSALTMIEGNIFKKRICFKAAEDNLDELLSYKEARFKSHGGEYENSFSGMESSLTTIKNSLGELKSISLKSEKYLEIGNKAVDQIKSILSQLSKLSKAHSKKLIAEFDVNTVVVEATSMIFPSSRIEKQLVLCEKPWPVNLDYVSMFRILLNLVVNSVQAMPNGGSLTCKTENKIINNKRYVKFTVADTGGGIPPEVVNEIDQPHATTKTGGHGYGLCVVSSLIRNCGGEKEIRSHAGLGTEFEFLIPALTDHTAEVKNILHKYSNTAS